MGWFDGITNLVGDIGSGLGGLFGNSTDTSSPPIQTQKVNKGLFGFNTDETKDWLSDIGELVGTGIGIYQAIENWDDDDSGSTSSPSPTGAWPFYNYNPNLSASDFAFQPNWYFVIIGVVLLLVILLIKK